MPKNRTALAISSAPLPEKGIRHSEMLITINPNKTFVSKKSAGFDDMIKKLTILGNFILKKSNLLRMLKFAEGDLQSNMHLIKEIDPDRTATVEWGSQTHRLHLHITFYIKHKTKIQLDRARIQKVASSLLDLDGNTLHINISATGMPNFKDYVKKYRKE